MDQPRCHTVHWPTALAWLAGTLVISYPLGWIAARVEQVYAPLLLFPILLGLVVAIAACALALATNTGFRPLVLTGVALSALATTGWLHWHSFSEVTAQAQASYDKKLGEHAGQLAAMGALPAPPTHDFGVYLTQQAAAGRSVGFGAKLQGGWVWALWALEAVLAVAAALGVTTVFLRQAYCDGCRSWYRPIRQGTFPRDMSRLAPTAIPGEAPSDIPLDYRLLHCQSGCGPTGLELSWKGGTGPAGAISAGHCTVWLSPDQRRELLTALDSAAEPRSKPADG